MRPRPTGPPPATAPPLHDEQPATWTWAFNSEEGGWYPKSLAATEEEQAEAYVDACRRDIAGVERRLEHLDDPCGIGSTLPEHRARVRAELEAHLAAAQRELDLALVRLAELRGEVSETTLSPRRGERTLGRRGRRG